MQMTSFQKLQNLVQITDRATRDNLSDIELTRVSIYEIAMHAFLSEVLTLERMNKIINAIKKGVNSHKATADNSAVSITAVLQQAAYRGLCSAACEGLTAVGLAHTEFMKQNRYGIADDVYKTLLKETLQLKFQMDQITMLSGWQLNLDVTSTQHHWFSQLMKPSTPHLHYDNTPALPWCDHFFELCGYQKISNYKNPSSSLMLLGLFSSGALVGMRSTSCNGY